MSVCGAKTNLEVGKLTHFGHSIAMLMRTSPRHDVTSENGPLTNAEETSMTIYISQGRYTAAAIKGMSAKPEDRSEAVAELFAAAGARLLSWYLTLGSYDWLIIAGALDEPTMMSAVP